MTSAVLTQASIEALIQSFSAAGLVQITQEVVARNPNASAKIAQQIIEVLYKEPRALLSQQTLEVVWYNPVHTNALTAQQVLEALSSVQSIALMAQQVVEVLNFNASKAKLAQQVLEVLSPPTNTSAKTAQQVLEVLYYPC